MVDIRFRARDAFRDLLSDPANGFNAKYAEIATARGIDPVAIVFTDQSQFFEGYVDAGNQNLSPLSPEPLAIALSTGDGSGPELGIRDRMRVNEQFAVTLFCAYVARDGLEVSKETEDVLDCIHGAVLGCITQPGLDSYGVIYGGQFECRRSPYGMLPDGFRFDVTYNFTVEVSV